MCAAHRALLVHRRDGRGGHQEKLDEGECNRLEDPSDQGRSDEDQAHRED